MLPSGNKLNSVEFKTTFEKARKVHTANLMVCILGEQEKFKSAVVVSKKESRTAIMRNYKRRVVFNVLAEVYGMNKKYMDDKHIIVLFKKKSLSIGYTQIGDQIKEALSKV